MKVEYLQPEGEYKEFLRITRPCFFNCFCTTKPSLDVYYTLEETEELIGKIVNTDTCELAIFNIYNKYNLNVPAYEAKTDYYKQCCIEPKEEIAIDIIECISERVVGRITKICDPRDYEKVIPNSFSMTFLENLDMELKILFLVLGLYLKHYYHKDVTTELYYDMLKNKEKKEKDKEKEEEEDRKSVG